MERLNLTKQQLILARKFFLELQEETKENTEFSENAIGSRLVKTKDNKKEGCGSN